MPWGCHVSATIGRVVDRARELSNVLNVEKVLRGLDPIASDFVRRHDNRDVLGAIVQRHLNRAQAGERLAGPGAVGD
jgi:hypothetical protein